MTDQLNVFTEAHKKTAHALFVNVRAFVAKHGVEKVGFLTLTFSDECRNTKEAQRRFNSFATGFLRKEFSEYIAVFERHKSGVIHYHLLVPMDFNIRRGFDWDQVKRRNYRSASRYLRGVWAKFREIAPRYQFGRCELMPVKSNAVGVARYVGKYISKSINQRTEEDKGVRLVRCSRSARIATTRFAWVTPGTYLWRARCGKIAEELGVSDMDGLRHVMGPKWAWAVGGYAMNMKLTDFGDFEYPDAETARRDGHDVAYEIENTVTSIDLNTGQKKEVAMGKKARIKGERKLKEAIGDLDPVFAVAEHWQSDSAKAAQFRETAAARFLTEEQEEEAEKNGRMITAAARQAEAEEWSEKIAEGGVSAVFEFLRTYEPPKA